ncbi:MAG: 4Fe-4S binding protein [Clostridiales bacterium]|nr:4Fe-4S binding protein [Candidatus Blautia equi]
MNNLKISRIKRKLIQIAAFGFSNIHASNLASAKIYIGKWKYFCNPGLNCYSCPAATLSCPIGALQAVNGSMKFGFSFYIVGFLLAVGVLFGRLICGFICPFGLVQELIGKIPLPKFHLPKWMTYIKYGVLLWFVLLWPWIIKSQNLFGIGDPTFCKYICPAGLLLGGVPLLVGDSNLHQVIGPIFSIKLVILITVLIGCMIVIRFFCKVLCPLGAIYGLLNKISFYQLHVDKTICTGCGICAHACPMDVKPAVTENSAECIRCGECAHACPHQAIHLGFFKDSKK